MIGWPRLPDSCTFMKWRGGVMTVRGCFGSLSDALAAADTSGMPASTAAVAMARSDILSLLRWASCATLYPSSIQQSAARGLLR